MSSKSRRLFRVNSPMRTGRGRRRWLLLAGVVALIAVGCAGEVSDRTSGARHRRARRRARAPPSRAPRRPRPSPRRRPPPCPRRRRPRSSAKAPKGRPSSSCNVGSRSSASGPARSTVATATRPTRRSWPSRSTRGSTPTAMPARSRRPRSRTGLTRPGPRGGSTPRIEVDIDRQVAFVVAGDGTTKIINVSSGNEKALRPTAGRDGRGAHATGSYEIERGSTASASPRSARCTGRCTSRAASRCTARSNVPGYPASHGCVRTTNPDQDFVFDTLPNGAQVEIYSA